MASRQMTKILINIINHQGNVSKDHEGTTPHPLGQLKSEDSSKHWQERRATETLLRFWWEIEGGTALWRTL